MSQNGDRSKQGNVYNYSRKHIKNVKVSLTNVQIPYAGSPRVCD
jgi:hypothetical protein